MIWVCLASVAIRDLMLTEEKISWRENRNDVADSTDVAEFFTIITSNYYLEQWQILHLQ